jgi:hypothetical protein
MQRHAFRLTLAVAQVLSPCSTAMIEMVLTTGASVTRELMPRSIRRSFSWICIDMGEEASEALFCYRLEGEDASRDNIEILEDVAEQLG